jgi:hypothetical protein
LAKAKKRIVAGWQYEIAKRAHRDAQLGSKHPPEWRTNSAMMMGNQNGKALKGYKQTPEHRANNSAAKKGTHPKQSPETRADHSAMLIAFNRSPEQRARVRARMMGNTFGSALNGRTRPPEVIAKSSAKLKGRKHTPEHNAKISAGLCAAYAKKDPSRRGILPG